MAAANSATTATRRVPGRPFAKGQSGNPSGRPKKIADLVAAAQEHSVLALETLASVARQGPPAARVAAARELLDRGYGKAPQTLQGPGGAPLIPTKLGEMSDEQLAAIAAGGSATAA
jgi:hypothetical protein